MNEILDIYRLYAKNFQLNLFEESWTKEDIERLAGLLEKIGSKIENGSIVVNALKRQLDTYSDPPDTVYPLLNIRDTVFEIESLLYFKDQEKKPDQLIEEKKPKSLLKFVKEKSKEKELELERDEIGKWKKVLDEKPIKKYGTIRIYPTIKDYIWDRLPADFKHMDVMALFKEFHEKKLGRKMIRSSYKTYASSYIRYFREHDPPMLSWKYFNYSKDPDKYKIVDKEPEKKEEKIIIPMKPDFEWKPWEIQILEEHRPHHTAKFIHETFLPHRTAVGIAKKGEKLGIKKIMKHEEKSERLQLKLWRTEEDDIIRECHPHMLIEEYIGRLPGRTINAVNKRASYLKVKKAKDTKQEKAEEIIKDELTKDAGLLTDGTKKLLSEEHVDEKAEEPIEPEPLTEPIKPKPPNPFHEGSAEHHLYRIAVETNWPSFKKGTPLIMIMRRMSEFSKDEIKKAIDTLVKERKAKMLPNNSIAFFE